MYPADDCGTSPKVICYLKIMKTWLSFIRNILSFRWLQFEKQIFKAVWVCSRQTTAGPLPEKKSRGHLPGKNPQSFVLFIDFLWYPTCSFWITFQQLFLDTTHSASQTVFEKLFLLSPHPISFLNPLGLLYDYSPTLTIVAPIFSNVSIDIRTTTLSQANGTRTIPQKTYGQYSSAGPPC